MTQETSQPVPEPASESAHEGQIVIGDIRTVNAAAGAGAPTVKYVHYPGAQQLILWLPQSGYHGYGELTVTHGADVIERATVRDRLNGSVQILWNTLPWPPGEYAIAISHADGWRHEVHLHKLDAGVAPPAPEPVSPPPAEDRPPIVYRDGSGNVIPDADIEMRVGALNDLTRRLSRRLEYEGTYRAGSVIYMDGVHRITFYNEMCGGGVHAAIDIPTVEQWESATGAPLSLRDEILEFVAQRVQQEQASTWKYRITDRSIEFY